MTDEIKSAQKMQDEQWVEKRMLYLAQQAKAQLAAKDAEISRFEEQVNTMKLATPALDSVGIAAPHPRMLMERYREVLEQRFQQPLAAKDALLRQLHNLLTKLNKEDNARQFLTGQEIAELDMAISAINKELK